MPKLLSAEKREQKFAAMRQRQQWLEEARAAKWAGLPPPAPPRPAKPVARPVEPQVYRVKQLAEMLQVSSQTIINWFRDRAVKVTSKGGPVRKKTTLLIPHEVYEEWKREHL
jgi:transposase